MRLISQRETMQHQNSRPRPPHAELLFRGHRVVAIAMTAVLALPWVARAGFDGGCGVTGTGDCFDPGATPYCDDFCDGEPCDGCCERVCGGDPFCCDEVAGVWDGFCSNEAQLLCTCVPDRDEPANDECRGASFLEIGDSPISNSCATIGGPDHSAAECTDGPDGLDRMGYDVWYKFEAELPGALTLSTCDQLDETWDSVIAVYQGCNCQALSDPPLACNQDGLECAHGSSLLVVDVLPNTCYLIRIGSTFLGAAGSGVITLSGDFCPDFDNDGQVRTTDLILLLSSWGFCSGCIADLDFNGQVGVSDLIGLLGKWGLCP